MNNIEFQVQIKIDKATKTYTMSKSEIEQFVCNKAREDHPEAKRITAVSVNLGIRLT